MRGQWHRPVTHPKTGRAAPEGADPVLTALSRALEPAEGHDWDLFVERQRLAGRSNIYVIQARAPKEGQVHWVVKQPHTGWSQDDVDNPLTAEDEYAALVRLDSHFKRRGGPFRVPVPVALLPEINAFAMEYVTGPTVKSLLNYGTVLRPATLLDGLAAAGTFLRHLHALEAPPPAEVNLRDEADRVLAVAEEKLHPLGLSLPDRVRSTLVAFPSLRVPSPRARLHGDFGPANILLEEGGTTVGLDASLHAVGYPEDDLVRFVAVMSGAIRLAPELVFFPVARVRRQLEDRLLRAYYQSPARPPLFELRYLHQLARRWVRLRELAQQGGRHAALLHTRFTVVGMQMRLLMKDAERRLVHSVGG